MPHTTRSIPLLFMTGLFVAACGGGDEGGGASQAPATAAPSAAAPAALTETELEQGLGPIRDLRLGELDAALVSQGEEVFTLKCSACHKLAERYVGPPLGDVLSRRRPEFVMNMMLNPDEMVQRHPVVRELLAQYYTPMTNQNLTQDEARAVLEYFRSQQSPGTSQ